VSTSNPMVKGKFDSCEKIADGLRPSVLLDIEIFAGQVFHDPSVTVSYRCKQVYNFHIRPEAHVLGARTRRDQQRTGHSQCAVRETQS
jgi:hypothetical protein